MAPPTRGAGTPKEHTYTNDHVAAILDNVAELLVALDKVPGLTITASVTVTEPRVADWDPEVTTETLPRSMTGLTTKELRNLLRDLAWHVANGQPYEGRAE